MHSPSPVASRVSRHPGNRIKRFDLGSIAPGDVVHVKAEASDWYFTRTSQSRVTSNQIHGVFVQTSSRNFGQITRNPSNCSIERVLEKDRPVYINGRQASGSVIQIFLNGEELT